MVGAVLVAECEHRIAASCFGACWALRALKRRACFERTPPERRRRPQVRAAAFGAQAQKRGAAPRALGRAGASRARRLGTVAPSGTRRTTGAPCPAPQLQVGASETPGGVLAAWPEGRMASRARHKHAWAHTENGTPPPKRGSAKVGGPGRRPSGAPQGAIVEPAAGGYGMQRPCASPVPLFVRGRSAPPPAARPQGSCPPRTFALTTQGDRGHSIMMPAATRTAGAAPFPPADGRIRNEAI